ncbi:MAG: hypothetical protein AB1646_11175 [Thermodesulfobacteriota bacterium]
MQSQEPDTSAESDGKREPRSPAMKAARRLLITCSIFVLCVAATAVSADLYSELSTWPFLGVVYLVALYYLLKSVSSLMKRRWLKGLFLVVMIPVGFFAQLPILGIAGWVAGRVHAWKAQEALAPVLRYVDEEIRNAGAAPEDIEPGLRLVVGRSRPAKVWYRPDNKEYLLRVWIVSFHYMEWSFPYGTGYSSRERAWTLVQGRSARFSREWEKATEYSYDAAADRWRAIVRSK